MEGVRGTFGQHVIVRFGDADVEGTFAGLCSDVFHDGEVYFELHDVFHFLGSLAAFVGGLHRDVGGVQLCGKRHCLGQVLLFFGQVADLPGSGVVLWVTSAMISFCWAVRRFSESIWLI